MGECPHYVSGCCSEATCSVAESTEVESCVGPMRHAWDCMRFQRDRAEAAEAELREYVCPVCDSRYGDKPYEFTEQEKADLVRQSKALGEVMQLVNNGELPRVGLANLVLDLYQKLTAVSRNRDACLRRHGEAQDDISGLIGRVQELGAEVARLKDALRLANDTLSAFVRYHSGSADVSDVYLCEQAQALLDSVGRDDVRKEAKPNG